MLLRKGVYPYEWAESIKKLKETHSFPCRDAFFSSLTQDTISPADYEHGLGMFNYFGCRNMLDYCELYCLLDTVLLLEVISSFREVIKNEFDLDSSHYISVPQLAFDCMLSTIDEPFQPMSDPEMILMCEQNIWGGVSFVNERHVNLSNYDREDEDKVQDHLLYTRVRGAR